MYGCQRFDSPPPICLFPEGKAENTADDEDGLNASLGLDEEEEEEYEEEEGTEMDDDGEATPTGAQGQHNALPAPAPVLVLGKPWNQVKKRSFFITLWSHSGLPQGCEPPVPVGIWAAVPTHTNHIVDMGKTHSQ
jgi:hypothetical protein